ncbi:MAG: preprotein translocase subunit SecG [Candidatus Omnitrophica bacterium]|nr:preprotein translocase subunit SecG [Candidatus Omnitrophota bacterium]
MVGFITFILIISCILIVTSILMQSGKGGGLAEGFSSAENLLGTQTNKVMVKVTGILVAIFIACCLSLAFLSTSKEQSLMRTVPQNKRPGTMNVDQLFNQAPSQTITINAADPASQAGSIPVDSAAK